MPGLHVDGPPRCVDGADSMPPSQERHGRPLRRRALLAGLPVAVAALALATRSKEQGREDGKKDATAAAPSLKAASSAWRVLGFHPGHPNGGGLQHFVDTEEWLGRSVPYMVQFGDGRNADIFLNNINGQFSVGKLGAARWVSSVRLAYAIPMAFGEMYDRSEDARRSLKGQWRSLVDGADGQRDVYRRAAEVLRDSGHGDAIIRLGWEFDNPQSRWYAGVDPALFAEAWRVVHGEFRAVSEDFVFDYNFTRGSATNALIEDAYPGAGFVDIIGLDVYDSGYEGVGGVPPGADAGWDDPERVWLEHQRPMLEAHRRFARTKGKPVSFPEWGLAGGGDAKRGVSGGENPSFIRNMYEWMNGFEEGWPGGIVYHAYFDIDAQHAGPHSLSSFPESAKVFRDLFGGAGNAASG